MSSRLERLGESGATHDSQSASRSGVEACARVRRLRWRSERGLSPVPERTGNIAPLTLFYSITVGLRVLQFFGRSSCVFAMTTKARFTTHLFSGSVQTGLVLTGVRSEPGHGTHLTSGVLFQSRLHIKLPKRKLKKKQDEAVASQASLKNKDRIATTGICTNFLIERGIKVHNLSGWCVFFSFLCKIARQTSG